MLLAIAYIILFLSLINLLRMAIFLVASDYFDIKKMKVSEIKEDLFYSKRYRPLVTVIVPAHNEEKTLERALISIFNSTYKNVDLIIVSDTSTDDTVRIAQRFRRKYKDNFKKVKIINVKVRGKARALNEGLKYASGSLFMCLDADSALAPEALSTAVQCFREKSLGSLSSNVKIFPNKGVLNILQRVEYLIGYQMKKAETITGIQYIVGGIGSMYRTKILRNLNFYETDTITEDIDLSMKLVEKYGKKKYIGYDPGVVAFTEAVVNVPDLIRQRFRWKYGRYQVFLKRKGLFFSQKPYHSRWLTSLYLPFTLFAELSFALEPISVLFILYLMFQYGDFAMIFCSLLTFCFYTVIQILGATQSYSRKERVSLVAFAPLAYFLMYILTFADYTATIKGLMSIRKLWKEYNSNSYGSCEWTHVVRGSESL